MTNCDFCKKTFGLRDEVTALAHTASDPFATVLYGLRAYIDSELDAHMVSHQMEPESRKKSIAIHNKEIEVISRTLMDLRRDCPTHLAYDGVALSVSVLDGAAKGCADCLVALVRKARETPVFTKEDAASLRKPITR